MRILICLFSFVFSMCVSAQSSSLIQFKNGEIADADDVNANFNNLNNRLKTVESTNKVVTACSTDDMSGNWIIVANNPKAVVQCNSLFRLGVMDVSQTRCTAYVNEFGSEPLNIKSAEFVIESDCKISMTIVDAADDSTDTGTAFMTNDKQVIIGYTQNDSDLNATSFHMIKVN